MEGTLETPREVPSVPADGTPARGWLAGHKRAVVGVLAILVLAPLVWYASTRPLGNVAGGVVSLGGAAQGVGP